MCHCLIGSCHISDPRQSQTNGETHSGVFCRCVCVCVSWSDIHSLKTFLSAPELQNGLLLNTCYFRKNLTQVFSKAHHSPAGGKRYVCMQPGVYSVLLSEFTKGAVYVLLLSQRWWWWVWAGWGILRAYCSISKFLGAGREGVMCGFALNVLFTKVIVLFCIVV